MRAWDWQYQLCANGGHRRGDPWCTATGYQTQAAFANGKWRAGRTIIIDSNNFHWAFCWRCARDEMKQFSVRVQSGWYHAGADQRVPTTNRWRVIMNGSIALMAVPIIACANKRISRWSSCDVICAVHAAYSWPSGLSHVPSEPFARMCARSMNISTEAISDKKLLTRSALIRGIVRERRVVGQIHAEKLSRKSTETHTHTHMNAKMGGKNQQWTKDKN